jgi:uncharacterized protein
VIELILLAASLLLSLFLIPIGLPGTWLMIASAITYDLVVGGEPIGWFTIGITVVIAVIAEIFEFTLAGRYAKKYGGSRRAGWGAILGGIVGAFMGVPVPIIGSVIGSFVGSFVGALVFEYTRTRSEIERAAAADHVAATRVAWGALIGRVVATAMKSAAGVIIAAWLLVAAWL